MVTAIAVLIGLCLLLLGIVAFLLGLVQEYQRAEKRYFTPVDVEPIDWDWKKGEPYDEQDTQS